MFRLYIQPSPSHSTDKVGTYDTLAAVVSEFHARANTLPAGGYIWIRRDHSTKTERIDGVVLPAQETILDRRRNRAGGFDTLTNTLCL